MSINTLPDPANQNQSGDFSEVFLQGINFFCFNLNQTEVAASLKPLMFLCLVIAFAWLMSMWMGV